MFTAILFVHALLTSLSSSFVWKPVDQNAKSSFPWNEAILKNENHPKNIILFLGQPTKDHVCKKEVLNYTEPEYVRFSTVISVKVCLKGNITHSEPLSPTKHLASHSDEQKCECEKAMQQAISDLMDLAKNVLHVPSGMIAVTNFSVYNINSGSKFNIHTYRGQHFQYRTGYDDSMINQTESQTEQDAQLENDGLMRALIREIHAIQTAFCRKFLQAFGYTGTPIETSEDRYYISDVPKLAHLVHDMLTKLQSSHTNKGFMLIVNGGELQEHCGTEEAVNLKNALMAAMTETDPAVTLVVVTSSCPENISEPFNITTKVYAQGPGSKELTNAEFLWNVPRILSRIWQKDFGPTPTPADNFILRAKISPVKNHSSQEANKGNYEKTSEFSNQTADNVTNEDQNFAFFEQAEKFNDQVEINTIDKEPEQQMKTLLKQGVKDENLERLFTNVGEAPHTAKTNNASNEVNKQQNSDAQKGLISAKKNVFPYTGSTKKENKGKPLVTHLPEQRIEANKTLLKLVAFDKNETNMQGHDLVRNGEKNISYNMPPLEEKERNSDKMLKGHISNLTLLSKAAKGEKSEDLNANILIRKMQHNKQKNILGNEPISNEIQSESISKNNNVSIHGKYPSSNIQLYKEILSHANYT